MALRPITPFSEAAELGVCGPGSLPLYPMKRIADNGYVAFDTDGFKIWRYSEEGSFVEIPTTKITPKTIQKQFSRKNSFEKISLV